MNFTGLGIGYTALVLFVVVLAACLAAYRALGLAPPTPTHRSRRQRPHARAAGAPLLCVRPGCDRPRDMSLPIFVCAPHFEQLLNICEDSRAERDDER